MFESSRDIMKSNGFGFVCWRVPKKLIDVCTCVIITFVVLIFSTIRNTFFCPWREETSITTTMMMRFNDNEEDGVDTVMN